MLRPAADPARHVRRRQLSDAASLTPSLGAPATVKPMSSHRLKRRLAVAVAICAVAAAGTAVALGATGEGHGHARHAAGHPGLIGRAAAYLGIDRSKLRADLRAGESLGEVAAATPGRSEAGLVAAIVAARKGALAKQEATLPERVSALVKSGGRSLIAGLAGHTGRSTRALTLSYLGIGRSRLAGELREGKSLAQVADATPGRSAAGLIEAITAGAAKRLQAATQDGRIGKAQAQARLARLRARVTETVDRVHRKG